MFLSQDMSDETNNSIVQSFPSPYAVIYVYLKHKMSDNVFRMSSLFKLGVFVF